MSEGDPPVCVKGGGGLLLPLGGDAEQEDWPQGLRVVLYMMGLAYTFMGVAIIADVFMGAIEKVTSKKVRRFNKESGKWFTFEVWNPTVANLSLMALGSSAPEILLNVIEIFRESMYLKGLGPSTIVGSAAFNMLIIIAVCVASIPSGEVRYIKEMPVYICTAMWSIFAYLWLLVILLAFSPNVVEVWEGIITFLFFPVLCGMAFLADKGYFSAGGVQEKKSCTIHENMTPEDLAKAEAKVREEHGKDLTEEQVARILAAVRPRPPTRATYRVEATRRMFGGKKVKIFGMQSLTRSISQQMSFLSGMPKKKVVPVSACDMQALDAKEISNTTSDKSDKAATFKVEDLGNSKGDSFFEFQHSRTAVLENVGTVSIKVFRTGALDFPAHVSYKTKDGDAKEGQDYLQIEGVLSFEVGQTEAFFDVVIIDDVAYEEDEVFYIDLFDPGTKVPGKTVLLGDKQMITMVIIDDDEPGVIRFEKETMSVSQQANCTDDYVVDVNVKRSKGASGAVSISYKTEMDSAVPGRDYEETDGTLKFADQQVDAVIPITVKHQGRYESTDRFRVILFEPKGGAKIDHDTDGGADRNILTVTIEADSEAKDRVDRVMGQMQVKWDKSKVGHANWASQFKAALYVNGGEDFDDDEGPPGCFEILMHWVSVPWKFMFAIVPPTDYCDGWLCLGCSLLMIGVVTLVIGELAQLLGCVLCISDDITAITFVALGTSLPDTFASRTAAVQDAHADASVGNVTGSNSVNVFLGLGLPWMIAAIHWAASGPSEEWNLLYQDAPGLDWLGEPGFRRQGFVVMAGTLSFSVTIFSTCAVCAIIILALRRRLIGGELGGPAFLKWSTSAALIMLWCIYIILSVWKSIQLSNGAGSGWCAG